VHDLGEFRDLGSAFLATAAHVLERGNENAGREKHNLEARVVTYGLTSPRARIIDLPQRRPNVAFLLAECLWQLDCRNDVGSLAYYAPAIGRFSSDGMRFTGSAYGKRLFSVNPVLGMSQWDHVLSCLREDSSSRRAVLTLAEPSEIRLNENRDVTCTGSLHFLMRNDALHLIVSMRSNDVMRGMQSDVFLFTILQEIAAIQLGVPLGSYRHITNLAQIYEPDLDWAKSCVGGRLTSSGTMLSLPQEDIWAAFAAVIEGEVKVRGGGTPPPVPGSLKCWLEILADHPTSPLGERHYAAILDEVGRGQGNLHSAP